LILNQLSEFFERRQILGAICSGFSDRRVARIVSGPALQTARFRAPVTPGITPTRSAL
jgi:hypothetical protein